MQSGVTYEIGTNEKDNVGSVCQLFVVRVEVNQLIRQLLYQIGTIEVNYMSCSPT